MIYVHFLKRNGCWNEKFLKHVCIEWGWYLYESYLCLFPVVRWIIFEKIYNDVRPIFKDHAIHRGTAMGRTTLRGDNWSCVLRVPQAVPLMRHRLRHRSYEAPLVWEAPPEPQLLWGTASKALQMRHRSPLLWGTALQMRHHQFWELGALHKPYTYEAPLFWGAARSMRQRLIQMRQASSVVRWVSVAVVIWVSTL